MTKLKEIIDSPVLGDLIKRILLAILFLVASSLLVNFIIRTLERLLYKDNDHPKRRTLFTVLSSFVKYVIYFVAFMIVLEIFGIKTSSIVAVAGIGSVALGFGAQALVEDMISGLFILAENQFNVGDYITIAAYSGTVEEMSLRTTTLRTALGELCIIPNGEIRGVKNYSRDFMNARFELPVPYGISIDKTMELVSRKLEDYFIPGKTMENPRVLGLGSYGSSSLNLLIFCKCHPGENWGVERDLKKFLVNVLEEEGIEIPYDTQTVHLKTDLGETKN